MNPDDALPRFLNEYLNDWTPFNAKSDEPLVLAKKQIKTNEDSYERTLTRLYGLKAPTPNKDAVAKRRPHYG